MISAPSVAAQLAHDPAATCHAALAAVDRLDVCEANIGWRDQVMKKRFLEHIEAFGGPVAFNRNVVRALRDALGRVQNEAELRYGGAPRVQPSAAPVASQPFPRAEDAAAYGTRKLGRGAARRAVERLSFPDGAAVLDIGCGDVCLLSDSNPRCSPRR